MVVVETDRGIGPLSTDRVTAKDGEPEVGEGGDGRVEVADGDPDVLEFDGHALDAVESERFAQSTWPGMCSHKWKPCWTAYPGDEISLVLACLVMGALS